MRGRAVVWSFVLALTAMGSTASGEPVSIDRRDHASTFRGDDISGSPLTISGDGSTVAVRRATDQSSVAVLGPVRTDWDVVGSDVVLSPTGRFAVTREARLDGRFERVDRQTGERLLFGSLIPAGRHVSGVDEAGDRVALDDGPRDRTSTMAWSIARDTSLTPPALTGNAAPPTRTRALSPAGDRLVVAEYNGSNSAVVLRFTEHDLIAGTSRSVERPPAHQNSIGDWSVSSDLRWVFFSTYADDQTTAIRHLHDLTTGEQFTEPIQGQVDEIVVTEAGTAVFRHVVRTGLVGRHVDVLMWQPGRAAGFTRLHIGSVVENSERIVPFVVSADGSTAAWTEIRRRFDGVTPSTGVAIVTARIDGSRFPPQPLSEPATANAPAVRLSPVPGA